MKNLNPISQKEFVSSTTLGREIGKFLETLKTKEAEKYIVLRNNSPEAVLLDINRYEEIVSLINELEEIIDDLVVQKEIFERLGREKNLKKGITLKELGKKHGME